HQPAFANIARLCIKPREIGQPHTVIVLEQYDTACARGLPQPGEKAALKLSAVVQQGGLRSYWQPIRAVKQRLVLHQPERLPALPGVASFNAQAGSPEVVRELAEWQFAPVFALPPENLFANGLEHGVVALMLMMARFAVAGMGDVLRPQRLVVRGQHLNLGGECAQMDSE